jgi:hypothetical protein
MQTLEISQVLAAIHYLNERLFRDILKMNFLQCPNVIIGRSSL